MEELVQQPAGHTGGHLSLQLLHVLVPRSHEVPLQDLQEEQGSGELETSPAPSQRPGAGGAAHLQLLLLLDPLLLGVGDKDEDRPGLVLLVQVLGSGLLGALSKEQTVRDGWTQVDDTQQNPAELMQ